MSVQLIHIAGDDLDVVNGFRKSLNRSHREFTEADAGLIQRGMRDGHTEPSRHAWAKFGVECSIGCARHFMTHKRYLAISEHSTRYSEMPEEFVMPALKQQVGKSMDYRFVELEHNAKQIAEQIVNDAYKHAYAAYQALLSLPGSPVSREDARSVLPLGTKTSLIVSGDLVAWLRFLSRRTDMHAQDEIREKANEIEKHLRTAFPHSVAAWDAEGRRPL